MKHYLLICLASLVSTFIYAQEEIYQIKEKDGKYQLLTPQFEEIIPGLYDALYPCDDAPDFVIAEKDNVFQIVYTKFKRSKTLIGNKTSLKLRDGQCYLEEGEYINITDNGKIGILKFPKKTMVKPRYETIVPLTNYEGIMLLFENPTYQFFYKSDETSSSKFTTEDPESTLAISNGKCNLEQKAVFLANTGQTWNFMKVDGTLQPIIRFDEIGNDIKRAQGMFITEQNEKFGFMNAAGKVMVPCKYDKVDWFEGKLSFVTFEGKVGAIDRKGIVKIAPVYEKLERHPKKGFKATLNKKQIYYLEPTGQTRDFKQPRMNAENKFGFVNEKEKKVLPYKWDGAREFSSGFAEVAVGRKWGYILHNGDLIIKAVFQDVRPFSEGVAAVMFEDKWGYIDHRGKWVIKNTFDSAADFYNGKAEVKKDGKVMKINHKGQEVKL